MKEQRIYYDNHVTMPVELARDGLSRDAIALYFVMKSFGPESRASLEAQAKRMNASVGLVKKAQKELSDKGWLFLTKEAYRQSPRVWWLPFKKGEKPKEGALLLAGMGSTKEPPIEKGPFPHPPKQYKGKHSKGTSSTSTSPSPASKRGSTEYSDAFLTWWGEYPSRRKTGKAECWEIWKKKVDESELLKMLETLTWQKKSADWTEENGKFIPGPAPYLRKGRWEDEKPEDPPDAGRKTRGGVAL